VDEGGNRRKKRGRERKEGLIKDKEGKVEERGNRG
jgi:hypothetical protein